MSKDKPIRCAKHGTELGDYYLCAMCIEEDSIESMRRLSTLHGLLLRMQDGNPCPCCGKPISASVRNDALSAMARAMQIGQENLKEARAELAKLGGNT